MPAFSCVQKLSQKCETAVDLFCDAVQTVLQKLQFSSCVIQMSSENSKHHMKVAARGSSQDDAAHHTALSGPRAARPGWDSFNTDPVKTQTSETLLSRCCGSRTLLFFPRSLL